MVTLPATRPRLTQLHVLLHPVFVAGRRTALPTVSYRLSRAAAVTFTFMRTRRSRAASPLISTTVDAGPGAHSLSIGRAIAKFFTPGSYVLTASPLGGAGAGKTRTARFRIMS
jgi:hypothetical protein